LQTMLDYLHRQTEEKATAAQTAASRQAAYEDLLWALFNTKEFLFNH
jgi:hypothetical protein